MQVLRLYFQFKKLLKTKLILQEDLIFLIRFLQKLILSTNTFDEI